MKSQSLWSLITFLVRPFTRSYWLEYVMLIPSLFGLYEREYWVAVANVGRNIYRVPQYLKVRHKLSSLLLPSYCDVETFPYVMIVYPPFLITYPRKLSAFQSIRPPTSESFLFSILLRLLCLLSLKSLSSLWFSIVRSRRIQCLYQYSLY